MKWNDIFGRDSKQQSYKEKFKIGCCKETKFRQYEKSRITIWQCNCSLDLCLSNQPMRAQHKINTIPTHVVGRKQHMKWMQENKEEILVWGVAAQIIWLLLCHPAVIMINMINVLRHQGEQPCIIDHRQRFSGDGLCTVYKDYNVRLQK